MNSCCGGGGGDEVSNPSYSRLDDDMVRKILSNLPVKSLMRFKCVCKNWRSLIESDPHFVYLHFTQSRIRPNLYISTNVVTERNTTSFYSADLFGVIDDGATVFRGTISRPEHILKPVNGLICFVREEYEVLIYNPITREETPWIKSSIVTKVEMMSDYSYQFYGFGFDPATKEHKVLCVLSKFKTKPITSHLTDVFCEVLTVGQNSWRRIDEVPPYKICENAFYANGILYWLCHQGSYSISELQHHPSFAEFIVAFDVGSEKFNRVIPIPNFILQTHHRVHGTQNLLLVDGRRIALLDINYIKLLSHPPNCNTTVKMWIFDDDHHHHASTSISSSNSSWIEETISLSSDLIGEYLFSFEAIEGTDVIIIRSDHRTRRIDPDRDVLPLYYYDRKKKTWLAPPRGGITINKPLHFPNIFNLYPTSRFNSHSDYVISTFVESLFPIQNHHHQQQH